MGWKTDWLYQCVFQEVADIWKRAQREATNAPKLFGPTPELFRIQQCGGVEWNNLFCLPPVLHEWTYAGAYVLECVPTHDPDPGHDFGKRHFFFYPQALIQFSICPDRKRVVLTAVLGPRYGRGYVLKAEGQGSKGKLIRDESAGRWVS